MSENLYLRLAKGATERPLADMALAFTGAVETLAAGREKFGWSPARIVKEIQGEIEQFQEASRWLDARRQI